MLHALGKILVGRISSKFFVPSKCVLVKGSYLYVYAGVARLLDVHLVMYVHCVVSWVPRTSLVQL